MVGESRRFLSQKRSHPGPRHVHLRNDEDTGERDGDREGEGREEDKDRKTVEKTRVVVSTLRHAISGPCTRSLDFRGVNLSSRTCTRLQRSKTKKEYFTCPYYWRGRPHSALGLRGCGRFHPRLGGVQIPGGGRTERRMSHTPEPAL